MNARLIIVLAALLALAALAALTIGETPLSLTQILAAITDPASPSGDVIWSIRAPRAAAAILVGAALGLSGGVMQGLLRNPLADPGVLGVSALGGLGAALAISGGLGMVAGAVEGSALIGALAAGAVIAIVAARFQEPEALILFGVALAAFGTAATTLVFNLSPSPVATSEVMAWLLGSVENRDWPQLGYAAVPMVVGAALCAWAARGLSMMTLGEETAALSGLPMGRMRIAAVAGAALMTGASVALAGIIGFVGLAAPHMVRGFSGNHPARLLPPSALAGALLLLIADILSRIIQTETPLRIGVMTALLGAPVFAVVAWRAARSWRT
ncbi:MAG: FecCD family ABC transporter permease [Caulobacteraceae bacterium]